MLDKIKDRKAVVVEVIEGLSEVAVGEVVEDEEVWQEVEQRLAALRSGESSQPA